MKIRIAALCVMVVLMHYGFALAHDEEHGGAALKESKGSMMGPKGSATDKGTAEAVNVGNTICPVSGEDVESAGGAVQHEYNGKIYNLCCKMCAKDFRKNPEKYSKIAEESVKKEDKGSH